ncbi:hypothetical protein [Arthrobacter sp. NEB 688]|uniref:hypothetical protein n=1 Tax=Arthrobacter sp. NEB 688 TaxID=904039 RepID=UPI001566AC2A|nr:hypothetical protein [Arthrobacter sp. NEB 688]QKE85123.1 hypothetical protein HL663_15055 [Arthrobacter sp. NEB 688]
MNERPGGWVYRTFQWRPADGDIEVWAQGLADDGWQTWTAGCGAACKIDGRPVFGVSLRRWFERPLAAPPR